MLSTEIQKEPIIRLFLYLDIEKLRFKLQIISVEYTFIIHIPLYNLKSNWQKKKKNDKYLKLHHFIN